VKVIGNLLDAHFRESQHKFDFRYQEFIYRLLWGFTGDIFCYAAQMTR